MLGSKYSNMRYVIRNYFGDYPMIFYRLYGLKSKNRDLFVTLNTQIVIEGFPRSGNSFAVTAFNYVQNQRVSLAHHIHVPAQVIRAAKLEIPTMILLRKPEDAISSFLLMYPRITILNAFKAYFNFYNKIWHYVDSFIVVSFEELTKNFGRSIARVNQRFGTNFNPKTPVGDDLSKIFEILDYVNLTQGHGLEVQKGRPSNLKEELKKKVKKKLLTPKYSLQMGKTQEIYRKYIDDTRSYLKKNIYSAGTE